MTKKVKKGPSRIKGKPWVRGLPFSCQYWNSRYLMPWLEFSMCKLAMVENQKKRDSETTLDALVRWRRWQRELL